MWALGVKNAALYGNAESTPLSIDLIAARGKLTPRASLAEHTRAEAAGVDIQVSRQLQLAKSAAADVQASLGGDRATATNLLVGQLETAEQTEALIAYLPPSNFTSAPGDKLAGSAPASVRAKGKVTRFPGLKYDPKDPLLAVVKANPATSSRAPR